MLRRFGLSLGYRMPERKGEKMRYAKYHELKALSALLYIAHGLQRQTRERRADLYKLLKIMYFADKDHLAHFGRPIVGDFYVAMGDGPVPSRMYDMVKSVRGDGYYATEELQGDLRTFFEVKEQITIVPKRKPDMDELSKSNLECIDAAIRKYKHYTYSRLKNESHDSAYRNADKTNRIAFEHIAKAGGASAKMLRYTKLQIENDNLFS
jgi:uncharacterized phage-associated protein